MHLGSIMVAKGEFRGFQAQDQMMWCCGMVIERSQFYVIENGSVTVDGVYAIYGIDTAALINN